MTAPTLAGTPPTKAVVGSTYSATFTITGGTPPYVAAGFKGSNPGLVITVTGNVATVIGLLKDAGAFKNLIAQVRDSNGVVGQSPRWTIAVAGTAPPVIPPVVIPPVVPPTNPGIRPIGLGFRPDFAPAKYDPSKIPSSAIMASGDISATLAAAHSSGRDIVIAGDCTCSKVGFANAGIWGRPVTNAPQMPRQPKITYTGPALDFISPAFMYAVNDDLRFFGVAFVNFGLIAGAAITSTEAKPFPNHTWATGFRRAVSVAQGGVAIAVDPGKFPSKLGARGPAINIQGCHILDCHQVFMAVSDSAYITINAHDNDIEGTFGGFDANTSICPDVTGSGNEWHGCVGDRMQPDTNSHGLGTFWKFGIENTYHKLVKTHSIQLANNWYHDINSLCRHNDTNTSVAFDARNVNPFGFSKVASGDKVAARSATCSVVIEYERCERLQSMFGREDCNAWYGKMMGGVFRHSIIDACGATNMKPKGYEDGSEFASGFKNPGAWDGLDPNAFFIVHDVTFKNLAPRTTLPQAGLMGFKIDGYAMPTYELDITFVNYVDTADANAGAMRNYDSFPAGIWIDGSRFIDCTFKNGAPAINLHQCGKSKGAITNTKFWGGTENAAIIVDGSGVSIEQASAGSGTASYNV